jgi:hypothetical protein
VGAEKVMDTRTLDDASACAMEDTDSRSVGIVMSLRCFLFGAVCEITGYVSNRASTFARYAGLIELWAGNRRAQYRLRLRAVHTSPPGQQLQVGTISLWKALDKAAQTDLLQVLTVQLR